MKISQTTVCISKYKLHVANCSYILINVCVHIYSSDLYETPNKKSKENKDTGPGAEQPLQYDVCKKLSDSYTYI